MAQGYDRVYLFLGESVVSGLASPRLKQRNKVCDASGDSTSVDRAIGARIREMRMLAGITQQALASRVGVSVQQIQNYEYGASRISAAQLLRVTEIAGVSMGVFFQGVSSSGLSLDRAEEAALEHRHEIDLIRSFRRLRDDNVRQWALKLLSILESSPGNSSDKLVQDRVS